MSLKNIDKTGAILSSKVGKLTRTQHQKLLSHLNSKHCFDISPKTSKTHDKSSKSKGECNMIK